MNEQLDSLQWAIVAYIAKKNGNKAAEKYADRKCDEEIKREIAENREWQRQLRERC